MVAVMEPYLSHMCRRRLGLSAAPVTTRFAESRVQILSRRRRSEGSESAAANAQRPYY